MATKTTTTTPAAAPPTLLSFPRSIFAAVSPSTFLQAHLTPENSVRANGRAITEFRTPLVNTGSLSHCNGSAVVRLGNTTAVCGVRAEVLRMEGSDGVERGAGRREGGGDGDAEEEEDDAEELDTLRLLVPNIELSTGSAPSLLPGQPPSAVAQALVTRIRGLLLSTRLVRAEDLRILYTPPRIEGTGTEETPGLGFDEVQVEQEQEVKGYWTLYIDTMFISLDGNAFDAAWAAVLAALRDTKIPKACWDEELEMIVCDDKASEARGLRLRGNPISASFAVFESENGNGAGEKVLGEEGERAWALCDPDAFEEGLCREVCTVVVDCGGKDRRRCVRRIEKSGGGVVGRDVLPGLVKRAEQRWREWMDVLEA